MTNRRSTMNELTRVAQIVRDWWDVEPEPNWDDLREHDEKDLMEKYGLVEPESGHLLRLLVLEQTDHQFNMYGLPDELAPLLRETIQESVHQEYEGWTEEEKVIIRAYLADLCSAVHLSTD